MAIAKSAELCQVSFTITEATRRENPLASIIKIGTLCVPN